MLRDTVSYAGLTIAKTVGVSILAFEKPSCTITYNISAEPEIYLSIQKQKKGYSDMCHGYT